MCIMTPLTRFSYCTVEPSSHNGPGQLIMYKYTQKQLTSHEPTLLIRDSEQALCSQVTNSVQKTAPLK